jgi:hypothetical protein
MTWVYPVVPTKDTLLILVKVLYIRRMAPKMTDINHG